MLPIQAGFIRAALVCSSGLCLFAPASVVQASGSRGRTAVNWNAVRDYRLARPGIMTTKPTTRS